MIQHASTVHLCALGGTGEELVTREGNKERVQRVRGKSREIACGLAESKKGA